MYGTFSVPARRPSSWWPPIRNGRQGVPRRDEEHADALGRVQLVAGERQAGPRAGTRRSRSMGSLPTDCVASVWKTIAGSVSLVIRESCSTGKMTPVSLLACMMVTSSVSRPQRADEVADVEVAAGRRPAGTSRRSRCARGPCTLPSTAGCSTAVVMTWRRSGIGLGGAEDRRVVALRGTGGEEDLLLCFGPHACRSARRWSCGPGPPLRPRARAGSYIELGLKYVSSEERRHRLDDFGGDGGGGVVVGVDESASGSCQLSAVRVHPALVRFSDLDHPDPLVHHVLQRLLDHQLQGLARAGAAPQAPSSRQKTGCP